MPQLRLLILLPLIPLLGGATGAAAQVWQPGRPATPPRATTPPRPEPAPATAPPEREVHHDGGYGYYDPYGYRVSPPPELPGCTIVLSGAVSGVYGCHLAQGAWRDLYNEGSLTVLFNVGDVLLNAPTVEVRLGFRGAPAAGLTLAGPAQTLRGSFVRVRWGNQVWNADAGSGSFVLRLARAAPTGSTVDGAVYAVAGRVEAELPARWGSASRGVVRARIILD